MEGGKAEVVGRTAHGKMSHLPETVSKAACLKVKSMNWSGSNSKAE